MGGAHSKTCPIPDGARDVSHTGTAHKPMLYVSGISTAITLIICLSLIGLHLRRYRSPKEQRQIIRIVLAPFVFALVSFFEVYSYKAAPYIDPLSDLYEAFGLCALFLLYMQYAAPGGTFDDATFDAVKNAHEGESLDFDWPRITWMMVFQFPVTELVAVIIQEATEAAGAYCVQSLSPRFGHLWVTIISSLGVGLAVVSILRFYGRMKNRMKVRRGLAKLVCFKLIVFLRFIQTIVFSILLNHNLIKPSAALGYYDVLYGLENTIVCVEMVLLSLGFWYAYSSTEYNSSGSVANTQCLPIFRAIADAINPWDFFAGVGRVFGIITHLQRTGGFAAWTSHRKQNKRSERGQGRYRTIDGMGSLPRPGQSYAGVHDDHDVYDAQLLYHTPASSPPPAHHVEFGR